MRSLVSLLVVLVCATSVQADWPIVQTVDSGGNVGEYTSLALDDSGYPRISYRDKNNSSLKYAAWNGTSWDIQTVDSSGSVGAWTSLALDTNGDPHISYHANNGLNYTAWDSTLNDYLGGWDTQTVDPQHPAGGYGGGWTSLALDSNGDPRITYHYVCPASPSSNYHQLRYASWNGSSWVRQTVDSISSYSGYLGEYTSLAVDSSDRPNISYWDGGNGDLKYAFWTGSAWELDTVDTGGVVGQYTSLAVDSSGFSHVTYWDASNGDLKYALWTGASWYISPVDSGGVVGQYTSLVLDSFYPRISYYDVTNADLKYAAWDGSSWDIQTVDSPDTVGQWTSLAVDSRGFAHISYYDATNGDLMYATNADEVPEPGTWLLLACTGALGAALRRRRDKK